MSPGPRPSRPRRLVDEPGLVMATDGGLVLCEVSGRFHGGMIRSIREAHLALVEGARGGEKGAILVVVRERVLRVPASAGAADVAQGREALAQLAPRIAALAIVLEGRGVVPTLARAFTAGGALLGGAAHPARVFADAHDAARWLAPHVPSPGPRDAEGVLAALGALFP